MIRSTGTAARRCLTHRNGGFVGPVLGVLTACLLPGAAALAQDPATKGLPPTYEELVKEGAVLAERLCSSCHLVDGARNSIAQAGVPSFKAVANAPGQSAQRIRNVLIMPHAPMPDVRLSNPEIDRLLAYIDSLRDGASGPPLVPRRSPGEKPQYPDPS